MHITLQSRTRTKRCPECAVDFPVVFGTVHDAATPAGLFLIALHGHSPKGPLAHLAIALLDDTGSDARPVAAALVVSADAGQFAFSIVEWAESPWKDEAYLGEMLGRDAVLASSRRQDFLDIADRLVGDLPEVRAYFA